MDQSYQLIYRSRFNASRIDKPLAVLRDILRSSSNNNIVAGVTGYLLFDGVTFLQVLEGDEPSVRNTFHRIANDARHSSTQVLQAGAVATRHFEKWSMGGYFRDERDIEIFKRHGIGSCSLSPVLPDRALALIRDLVAHRKTIAL